MDHGPRRVRVARLENALKFFSEVLQLCRADMPGTAFFDDHGLHILDGRGLCGRIEW